jgi:cysteine synthase A
MKQNILGTIGNRPLVKLNKVVDKNSAKIYARLDNLNPRSSIKDRIGLSSIERRKLLKIFGAEIILTEG